MNPLTIEYRPIESALGYMAGSDGSIRSTSRTIIKPNGRGGSSTCKITGRILKPWLAGPGYQYVHLGKEGPKCAVHRLVCIAFHGQPPKDHEVAHLDGNRMNNAQNNLAWVTHSENEKHKQIHGTAPDYGVLRWGTRKVFKDDYVTIYVLHKFFKLSRIELAKSYKVSRTPIDKAINTVRSVLAKMNVKILAIN